jgi:hypothetical protein
MPPLAQSWPKNWSELRSNPGENVTSEQRQPIVVIACQVFQSLIEKFIPEAMATQIIFKDYGLHRLPSKLTWAIQEEIDKITTPSLIILGYGLCGNGLKGIQSREHTLLIPRTDDCIAILLGSYKSYIQEFDSVPGTYYLTKGWLESGSNPLQEYQEYVIKYNEKEASWLIDQLYQNYERLVFVAHSQEEMEKYRPQAQEVAEFCKRWGMRYEEILGSDLYVQRLIEFANTPDKADSDFLLIPPGSEVTQMMFMR